MPRPGENTIDNQLNEIQNREQLSSKEAEQLEQILKKAQEGSLEMEAVRAEQEKKDQATADQLVVIQGAKVKMGSHLGEFKVLNDVPKTQDKLTGTIIEKQISNFTFYDGFKLISIQGDWQNHGTYKVQDNEVLIKKSTLLVTGKMPGKAPIETGNIEFINSGQINIPESIDTKGAPLPDKPKTGKYFVRGWWTNHKDEPIKRAIYGQELKFHIEMDQTHTEVGDEVHFSLYDNDRHTFGNDEIKDKDDPIPLKYKDGSGKPYAYEKINSEHKVIIKFHTTSALEQWSILDQDKIFELYFRCSYDNRGKKENVELPYDLHEYLDLGAIVIDRYKMPGLNPEGTDIAEDMAYGTGFPLQSFEKEMRDTHLQAAIKQYKKDYTTFGFDIDLHADFANQEPKTIELEEIVVTAKAKPKDDKYIDLHSPVKIDNTRVENLPKIPSHEQLEQVKLERNERNQKAIYTYEEIKKLGLFMNFTVNVHNDKEDEKYLWSDFRIMARGLLSRGKLEDNIGLMIDKFQRNEGGIYENQDLTNAVLENPATLTYLQAVEDYIAEQLKTKFSTLEEAEDKEPYFRIIEDKEIKYSNSSWKRDKKGKEKFGSPAYTWKRDWNVLRGETIAVNDVWAAEVILKELKLEEDDYTAKYEVTLWDHFGLDKPDLEKFYAYGAGFRAWFVLQHLWGYKPFLTKISFTKEFTGNLNKGIEELKTERQEKRQKEANEWAEKEIEKIKREPKF